MSADPRLDQISDENEDHLGRCPECLQAASLDAVPADPQVQAILRRWENGSGELPWKDAGPETGREEENTAA